MASLFSPETPTISRREADGENKKFFFFKNLQLGCIIHYVNQYFTLISIFYSALRNPWTISVLCQCQIILIFIIFYF